MGHLKTVIILAGGFLLFSEAMPPKKLAGVALGMGGIVWRAWPPAAAVAMPLMRVRPGRRPGPARRGPRLDARSAPTSGCMPDVLRIAAAPHGGGRRAWTRRADVPALGTRCDQPVSAPSRRSRRAGRYRARRRFSYLKMTAKRVTAKAAAAAAAEPEAAQPLKGGEGAGGALALSTTAAPVDSAQLGNGHAHPRRPGA